jgi:hypothetical protein
VVSLGKERPSWEICRRDTAPLRFLPDDGEGFTLRGDSRRLEYRGRKRNHRFTILGDESFEYDCILSREPETNVIALRLEGAENYDFFRQPDSLKNPLLAGSYAVYKKETFAGEGTGKLCHIHRPEIIDAAGRSVWGDVCVSGNSLVITIPETWLADARYPVVADPVIGTSTVGSQYLFLPPGSDPDDEPWELMFELEVAVNRFLVAQAITGQCTAYFYSYYRDSEAGGRAVLYADSPGQPAYKKSSAETHIDFDVRPGKPEGWRSGTFTTAGTIAAGSYVWFGAFAEYYFYPRFDYGQTLYHYWYEHLGYDIPATFPGYATYSMKLSMYFEYSAAQAYTRTLTQGVRLSDTRTRKSSCARRLALNARGTDMFNHASAYYRKHTAGLNGTDTLNRLKGYFRGIGEYLKISGASACFQNFLRTVCNAVHAAIQEKHNSTMSRSVAEETGAAESLTRGRGFFRTLLSPTSSFDIRGISFSRVRFIREGISAFTETGHTGDYIRGLYSEAASLAEHHHAGNYHRVNQDAAESGDVPLRSLFIFLRLVTAGLVRDYLIPRFLLANERLVLKSPVCRETVLDSRIH